MHFAGSFTLRAGDLRKGLADFLQDGLFKSTPTEISAKIARVTELSPSILIWIREYSIIRSNWVCKTPGAGNEMQCTAQPSDLVIHED